MSSERSPAPEPASTRFRWLQLSLSLLSIWAVAEAMQVWWRVPAPPPPPLPDRMQLQGAWLQRRSPGAAASALPDGVVLQSGADYGPSGGQPRLVLRWLALLSSGGSVNLDPGRLALSLLGPGGRGVCRIHDPRTGVLLGVAATGTEAMSLLRRKDPQGLQRLSWALGLRPWRSNRCLFVGVPAKP